MMNFITDKNSPELSAPDTPDFSLYEGVSTAVFVMQTDDFFLFANRTFYNISGYTVEELLGKKCSFILPAETEWKPFAGKSFSPSVYNKKLNATLTCKNGLVTDIEVSYTKQFIGNKVFCIVTIWDASENRNLADELVLQENKYQTLFENVLNCIVISSMETGMILEANKNTSELFGYQNRELRMLACSALVNDDDLYSAYCQSIEQSGFYKGQLTCIRKNGEYFRVNISSWVYINRQSTEKNICNCFIDVSRGEKLEAFLDDTNRMGQTGYYEFNLLTGQNMFSPITKQIIEVSPDYVPDIYRDLIFYKEGESRETLLRLINNCLTTGTGGEAELQLITAKGKEIWVKVIVNAEMEDGKCVRIFGTFQDINDTVLLYKKLKEKTSQVNKILQSVPDIILILDKEGRILTANEAVWPLWGYHPDEMTGVDKIQLVAEADREMTLAYREKLIFEKITYDFENRHIRKDGTEVKMSWSSSWDESEQKFYLVGRDLTEKLEKEKEVRHLSLIAAETINGALITDKEGRITWVNKSFERITGYTLEELIGKTPGSVLQGPDSDAAVIEKVRANINKRIPFTAEMINYRKDGVKLWMQTQAHPLYDSKGNLEGWFGLDRDISEQKKEEQKLKLFEFVFENANDLIIITDAATAADGGPKIIYVNPAFEKATGYTKEEVIGQSPRLLQGTETDATTTREIHYHLQYWIPVQADIINYKKNGEKFWNRLFITPVADSTGWFTNWISIQRDVTEEIEKQLKMEQEENERKKEITRALLEGEENHRKMMSMELHDNIAQLLLGAKLYLTQYRKKQRQEDIEEAMQIIEKSMLEVRSLSHNLAARELDEKDFSLTIKQLLDKLVNPGGIIVDFQTNIQNRSLTKDLRTNLYRITQEQLNNIIKHSRATVVSYELIQKENKLYLTIRDNGTGFDINNLSHGIGFTNIQSRTELFNGKCELHSKPGKGCTLYVELCIE